MANLKFDDNYFSREKADPQLLRASETVVSFDTTFESGELAKVKQWSSIRDSSLDVHALSWEIYAKNDNDLVDFVWWGKLSWAFANQTLIDIGPLTMFYDYGGSTKEPTAGPRHDLLKLAQAKIQGEWLDALRTFSKEQVLFYRGSYAYSQQVVILPERSGYGLLLSFGQEFEPQDQVRFRVNLHGIRHWSE